MLKGTTAAPLLPWLLLPGLIVSAMGCGASRAPADSPEDPSESDDRSAESVAESSPLEPAAPAPNCDDGTCFPCGEGICPRGAYCDLDAVGGAACAWLTECKDSPSCACVTRVLGNNCSCDESPGGPQAQCR